MISMAARSFRFLFSSNNDSNLTCFLNNCDPFLLPPPPPLPLESIPIDVHHPSRLVPNFLIAAASLLAFSFVLLLLFYSLLRRRRRRSLHPHPPPPPPQRPADGPLFDDDGGIHHVWFIRTVGLDGSTIAAIPTTVYKSGSDGGHCSVCLGEFRDGESVKSLPKCAHVFHVDCIDTWLGSHVNCPLCRAAVVVAPAPEGTQIKTGEGNQDACLDTIDLSNLTAGSSSSSSSVPPL